MKAYSMKCLELTKLIMLNITIFKTIFKNYSEITENQRQQYNIKNSQRKMYQ